MSEDENNEDKTSKNEEDEGFEDDLEDAFGEDEEIDGDDSAEDDGEKDSDKDKKKDKKEGDKDKDKDKKQSSAVIQKQKYRERLKVALDRIKALETKDDSKGNLSDEEKKEKQAEEYLAKKIKEVLGDLKKQEESSSAEEEEAFQEELEDVLEEHSDLTEKQLLDVCEELDVSPQQAVKIIQREMKLKGKEKPKLPNPKRGSGEVKEDGDDKKEKKPLTLDDINRDLKQKIRKGTL